MIAKYQYFYINIYLYIYIYKKKNCKYDVYIKEIENLKNIIKNRDEDIDKFKSLLEQTAL